MFRITVLSGVSTTTVKPSKTMRRISSLKFAPPSQIASHLLLKIGLFQRLLQSAKIFAVALKVSSTF